METAKPKNDMSAARAALAKKRLTERANESFTNKMELDLMDKPKKRKRVPSLSSSESFNESFDESMEEEMSTPSIHPLKAKGVSLELVPVAPPKVMSKPPKKKKQKQQDESVDPEPSSSKLSSILSTFGNGLADAVPKLLVMLAGFTITVALQTLPGVRQNHSSNTGSTLPTNPVLPSPTILNHLPDMVDHPSYLSSR